MTIEPFLFIIYSFACAVIIFKSQFFFVPAFSKRAMALLFIFKATIGILIGHFSSHIFSGDDSWFYFEMGKRMQQYAIENPVQYVKLMLGFIDSSNLVSYEHLLNWKNLPRYYDSETMIKLNSLIHFISFSSYNVHSLLFSYISFCGLTGFYKFFCSIFKTFSEPLFFLLVFTPSLLLWTSGIIKESLLVGVAGIFIFYLLELITTKKTIKQFVVTLLLFLFLFLIKPYFIFLLAPVLIAYWLNYFKERSKTNTLAIYIGVTSMCIVSFSVYETFTHSPPLPYSIALKQQSAMKNAIFMSAKTFNKPPVIASSWKSIIRNSPRAFFHTLFTPSFTLRNSLLQNLASLETYFFFILLLYGFCKSLNTNNYQFNFFMLCIVFIFFFYVLVGYTSATEGTIVRFKVPALIFILMLFYSSFLKNTFIKNKI